MSRLITGFIFGEQQAVLSSVWLLFVWFWAISLYYFIFFCTYNIVSLDARLFLGFFWRGG